MKTLISIVEGILDKDLDQQFDVPGNISKFVAKFKSLNFKFEWEATETILYRADSSDIYKDFDELIKPIKIESRKFPKERVGNVKSEHENDEDCCIIVLVHYNNGEDLIHICNPAVPESISINLRHFDGPHIGLSIFNGKPSKTRMKEVIKQPQSKIYFKYPPLVYNLIKSSIVAS